MNRFLFVAPPFVAHVNPMATISRELIQRGHEVAWVTYESMHKLLPDEARFYAATEDEAYQQVKAGIDASQVQTARILAESFMFYFRDITVPLARIMLPDVEAAVADFKPDMIVADQHALAGPFAARRLGIRWVTSAPSAQLLTNALDDFKSGRDWIVNLFTELQTELGLEPIEWPDRSRELVLVYTTRELIGEKIEIPAHYRLVGAAVEHRPDSTPFPWEKLDDKRPKLYVTLGTLFIGQAKRRFFSVLEEALANEDVQVIVTTPAEFMPAPPDNFIVRSWVPQMELLARVDAVLSHAGSTVNEVLSFGLPLIVAPIAVDQPIFAGLVAESGAGIRIRFGRIGAAELRKTVFEVLENPSYRQAAQRIQASFVKGGGTRGATDALEELLTEGRMN